MSSTGTRTAPAPTGGPDRAALLGHVPGADGWRGIAALLVLVSHVAYESGRSFQDAFGSLLARAEIGVAVFFVLSGFLLHRPFAVAHLAGGPRPRLRRYARARALRIFPAWWVVLAVVALTLERDVVTPGVLAANAALLQTYRPGLLLEELGQSWTLSTELAWYALLPLLALLLTRPARRGRGRQLRLELALVGVLVLTSTAYAVLVRGTDLLDPFVAGFWLPHYVGWFGLGMALAVLRTWLLLEPSAGQALRQLAAAPWSCWALAAVLYCLAASPVGGPRILVASTVWEGLVREGLYAAVAVLVLLPVTLGDGGGPVARLDAAPMVVLGNISYAVYLWHFPLKTVTFRATGTEAFTGGFWLNLVVLLALTLPVATASWYLVERPCLRLKGR